MRRSMNSPEAKFLNFELSWLEFNRRVLNEACDPRNPLLERVRFLQIFNSNLDEFFMKRVGSLKRKIRAEVVATGLQELSPIQQLTEVRKTLLPMLETQGAAFRQLLPELDRAGIKLLHWAELTEEERQYARDFFFKSLFPVLTPLAVDPGHPFPFLSNLSLSFGVMMRVPEAEGEELFARIKVPTIFPAWFRLNPGKDDSQPRFLSLFELIGRHLDSLFPGMELVDVMMFRITRNAEVAQDDEEDAEDLLEMVADDLRERRFAPVLRLEHGPNPNPRILKILLEELRIDPDDVYEAPVWLEYFQLSAIADCNRPELKFGNWTPLTPPSLTDPELNIFDSIRSNDLLVHHPYESFTATVERFIRTAAEDPKVVAIKMTLYRTGDDSPFTPLLIRAAEAGKQVVVLVELKARFDEERNILVAQALEKAGVHVVYGLVGFKTHSKLALVVRREEDGMRCYTHIGTGNYHAKTARMYTDLGLFTAKREFTDDVVHLFHYLTGRSLHWTFNKLLVAPIDMRTSFLRMIEREGEFAKQGIGGRIIAKMNTLEDREVIEALYAASAAGVQIDLIVRGVCALRPGVPGMSENIRVISVIGRFLEHSRIFFFGNGKENARDGEYFIGSADWMSRNLSARVEAITPIQEPAFREQLMQILNIMLADERQAWEMGADGKYTQRNGDGAKLSMGTHEKLMQLAISRSKKVTATRPVSVSGTSQIRVPSHYLQ